jgi:hypothetical protein
MLKMSKLKLVTISAGLAFLANNFAFLLSYIGLPWLLLPVMLLAPAGSSNIVFYLLGILQFFIIFLFVIGILNYGKRAA